MTRAGANLGLADAVEQRNHFAGPMNPTTIDDLFAPFDLAVFEQLPGGSFDPVGRLPE